MLVWYFPSIWVNVPQDAWLQTLGTSNQTNFLLFKDVLPNRFSFWGEKEQMTAGGAALYSCLIQTNRILTWCIIINPTSIQNPAVFIWCLAWSKFLGRFSRIRARHPNVPPLSIWKAIEKDDIFFSPGCMLSIHGKIQSVPWHLTNGERPEYTFWYLYCCGPNSDWNNIGTQMFSILVWLYISSPSHKKNIDLHIKIIQKHIKLKNVFI